MKMSPKTVLPSVLTGLAILSLVAPLGAAANSLDEEYTTTATSKSGASVASSSSELKPGPAWRTIGGTVKQIKGNVYTVEDYEGNQVQLHVSRDTKHLRGNKKVGDRVRAEITRSGFANSIQ